MFANEPLCGELQLMPTAKVQYYRLQQIAVYYS